MMVFAENLTHVHSSHKYSGCAQRLPGNGDSENQSPYPTPASLWGLTVPWRRREGKVQTNKTLAHENVSL